MAAQPINDNAIVRYLGPRFPSRKNPAPGVTVTVGRLLLVWSEPSLASVQADVAVAGTANTKTFDVDIALSEGRRVATIDTTAVADRTSFGLTWNAMRAAANRAEVTAHLVFHHADEREKQQ